MRPHVAFAGTGSFAVPVLRALNEIATIVLVCTRQSKAERGSAKELPVAVVAKELRLPRQLVKRGAELTEYLPEKLDAFIVTDFGLLIPPPVLQQFPNRVLNIHPSLLPKHRGATPIPAAILSGARKTGVTLMVLDEEVDHGPIIAQSVYQLHGNEYGLDLTTTLADLGADILSTNLLPYLAGTLRATPQRHKDASFTTLLSRTDGAVDPAHDSASIIYKKIRAYAPWPGCYTLLSDNGPTVKILSAEPITLPKQTKRESAATSARQTRPGFYRQQEMLLLATVNGWLNITLLQVAGGRPLTAAAFINGYRRTVPEIEPAHT